MDKFVGGKFVIRELIYSPYAHIAQYFLIVRNLYFLGEHGVFQHDITKILEQAQIFKPTFMFSAPRVFNKIHKIMLGLRDSSNVVKRVAFDKALTDKLYHLRNTEHYKHKFYDYMVFKPFRDLLGGNMQLMWSGSAPLGADVYEFFKVVLSCPFAQAYGMTEIGLASCQDFFDVTCVGSGNILPAMEFKIKDFTEMNYTVNDKDKNGNSMPRGELCVRGPTIIDYYYKNEAKTKEAFDKDGFFLTGDVVE